MWNTYTDVFPSDADAAEILLNADGSVVANEEKTFWETYDNLKRETDKFAMVSLCPG
jgi:hypothetical protein